MVYFGPDAIIYKVKKKTTKGNNLFPLLHHLIELTTHIRSFFSFKIKGKKENGKSDVAVLNLISEDNSLDCLTPWHPYISIHNVNICNIDIEEKKDKDVLALVIIGKRKRNRQE